MPVTNLIAHRLSRHADAKAVLRSREDELAIDDNATALFDTIKSSFLGRLSRVHGSFTTEDNAPLQRELEAFLAKECSFVQMSVAVTKQLMQMLEEQQSELDGHLLFAIEKSLDHHRLYLFIAGRSKLLTLDDALNVSSSYTLDTGPSLFGIKVDLAEWKERRNYAYLSLLPPRGNPALTESFYLLTGFSNQLNKEEATLNFLEGVETYATQVPEEAVHEYRAQVVDYCMEQEAQDSPVDLQGLSQAVDGIDSEAFLRHMASHNHEADDGLRVDRRSLRRYVKFAGREKDLAVSFSSYQLNKRVQYDAERDMLSIHGIPKSLRNQLLGHLKG